MFDIPWLTWFKTHERATLFVGLIFQMLVLVGMIGMKMMPVAFGETVLVRVVPVDPRDLFRGDYVILSYDFSQVPSQGVLGLPSSTSAEYRQARGSTVYVTLVPEADGKHWRADRFTTERPTGGEIYLRGQLVGWNQLAFGIESFYVQEGTGHDYEKALRKNQLSAEIAVGPEGQATLRGLKVVPPAKNASP